MFSSINPFSISLVLFPALLNFGLLIYIVHFLPKTKVTNLFILFLVGLLSWQLMELMLRFDLPLERVSYFGHIFSIGWLIIGPLLCHFAFRFTGMEIIDLRITKFLLYAPYVFFFGVYHAEGSPIYVYDSFWGYRLGIRPESFDLLHRLWMGSITILAIILLLKYAFKRDLEPYKRKQTLLITCGLLIPTLQGTVTQIIFPYFGLADIPLTTSMMTFFSITTIIALTRYNLFDPHESIDIKKVFATLESLIIIMTPDLKSRYFNPAVEEKLLDNHQGMAPLDLKDILSPEDYILFIEKNLPVLLDGNKVPDYETILIGQEGKILHMLISAQPIFNNGKLQYILLVCHDITSRRSMEQQLIRSNEKYMFISKATNDAIRDWDIEANSLTWEEGYTKLFGHCHLIPTSHLKSWIAYIHPDDFQLVNSSLNQSLNAKDKVIWKSEYRFKRSNGAYALVEDKAFIIRDDQGKAIRLIGVLQDITAQKKYLEEIEVQNQKLQEIAFIHSHRVRSPLANILGLITLFQGETDQEEREEIIETLQKTSYELDGIIREIVQKTNEAADPVPPSHLKVH